MTAQNLDPQNIQPRLYNQIGKLLEDMERGSDVDLYERIRKELDAKRATDATLRERIEDALADVTPITTRERIAALVAVGRLLTVFAALRREAGERDAAAGSAVRKYASAFNKAPDAARGRKAAGRRAGAGAAVGAALADADTDDDPDDGGEGA